MEWALIGMVQVGINWNGGIRRVCIIWEAGTGERECSLEGGRRRWGDMEGREGHCERESDKRREREKKIKEGMDCGGSYGEKGNANANTQKEKAQPCFQPCSRPSDRGSHATLGIPEKAVITVPPVSSSCNTHHSPLSSASLCSLLPTGEEILHLAPSSQPSSICTHSNQPTHSFNPHIPQ